MREAIHGIPAPSMHSSSGCQELHAACGSIKWGPVQYQRKQRWHAPQAALCPTSGAPLTVQAQKLDDMLEKRSEKVDHVLNFQVPDDVLVRPQRLPHPVEECCSLPSSSDCASCTGGCSCSSSSSGMQSWHSSVAICRHAVSSHP
jgi:hypothetical protein